VFNTALVSIIDYVFCGVLCRSATDGCLVVHNEYGKIRSKEGNEEIMGEFETGPALEYTGKQRQNCRYHTNRMDGGRISKQILQNAPRGISIGRQAQRWLETVTDHMI